MASSESAIVKDARTGEEFVRPQSPGGNPEPYQTPGGGEKQSLPARSRKKRDGDKHVL